MTFRPPIHLVKFVDINTHAKEIYSVFGTWRKHTINCTSELLPTFFSIYLYMLCTSSFSFILPNKRSLVFSCRFSNSQKLMTFRPPYIWRIKLAQKTIQYDLFSIFMRIFSQYPFIFYKITIYFL